MCLSAIVHQSSDNYERRAEKLTIALSAIEEYLNEVAISDHGMKTDEMIQTVNYTLSRSMQASIEFHDKMATECESRGNTSNMNYYKVMAQIYSELLK